MSSLSGALDESALRLPKSEPPAVDDVEMTSSTPSKPVPLDSEIGTHGQDEQDQEMEDLFGNDNDVDEARQGHDRSAAESPTASGQEVDYDRLPSPERERRHALEYEEDDNPPDTVDVVQEADVSFPNLPVPKSSDGNNWVIRMPNFVKMDAKPFHPDTYLGPEEEESMQGESLREKSMTIKLKVENTVRWRWIKDQNGQEQRQSNSRIIRWSDGTLSLLLGKELFDINQSIDTSASVLRQSVHPSTSSSQSLSQQTPTKPIPLVPSSSSSLLGNHGHGLTYLVAQHKRSQVLQSEAVITGYMSLRPTGMQSETHRMLVRAVGQKHNKVARLRMAPNPTFDPERDLRELAKLSAKKSRKKSDYMTMDELGARKRKHAVSRRTASSGVFSSDEEGDAEYERYDEEDEEIGSMRKAKRKPKVERKGGAEDYQEDDFVVADSDEEEGISTRKRGRGVEEAEEDALEKLDAKIEALDAKKKRSGGGAAKQQGNASDETEEVNDDMDVESEEEEDDMKVRRVGGGRKRAHIAMDEEEE